MDTAIFAAGCFWGVEEAFRGKVGVVKTTVGYTGGSTESPTYEQIRTGNTGHAEAVRVDYDPEVIDYETLLDIFWASHDPTQRNRQGPDVGTQYRSAIFCTSDQQKAAAEASRDALDPPKRGPIGRPIGRPIATEITTAGPFYDAENYHQQYFAKRGI